VVTSIFSGEEKEAWKGWKNGRFGSCSVCELVRITGHLMPGFYKLLEVNELKNGTQKYRFEPSPCAMSTIAPE
jgi:hypothetical protein